MVDQPNNQPNPQNNPYGTPEVNDLTSKKNKRFTFKPSKKLFIGLVLLLIAIILAVTMLIKSIGNDFTATPEFVPKEAVIEITKDGFAPELLSVEPGTVITWVNKDTEPHYIASNPYPDRTDNPDLDSGEPLGPGATYTFTAGQIDNTYGYHDDYNPELNGKIVVE